MRAGQRETRPGSMVERCRQPGGGGMALGAVLPELAVMRIVLGMAGVASCVQGGEDVVGMALRALQSCVRPGQGELRFCMVEGGRQPGSGSMAGVAEGAKLTVMGIVLGMAGVAGRIQCGKDVIDMAF